MSTEISIGQIVADAIHGQHALMQLKKYPVDLIITDISMPLMNGVELIKEINRNYSDVVVIALSGYDDFSFVKDALKSGAMDYILKYDLTEESVLSILEEVRISLFEIENHTCGFVASLLRVKNYRKEIVRAIKYLEENFRNKVILSDIAEYVSLSPNHLSKIFKEETGYNIITFLNHMRVEQVKKLVMETNLMNYEIAGEVGFENPTYMCRVFKNITEESIYTFKKNHS